MLFAEFCMETSLRQADERNFIFSLEESTVGKNRSSKQESSSQLSGFCGEAESERVAGCPPTRAAYRRKKKKIRRRTSRKKSSEDERHRTKQVGDALCDDERETRG